MEIVNSVSAIQNYPSCSDVLAERLKQGSGAASQKRVSEHVEGRNAVSSLRGPLHSLVCFIHSP